ncbi:maleylpyruvate isomerase N-terminal domain-containing protein [Rhodococcoides kroppenstedtii]|uniref:maleylpyruvate isomerase N-terminal domain-containing protein n=1 Tax=Rhodococcoides kroppenstedtii TaxID=293050 RepID=UPI00363C326B
MTLDHLATIAREGDRLAAMPADALSAPVPTVPGWTLEHVVRHTGKVHRWVASVLRAGPGVDVARIAREDVTSLPKGPDALEAYRDSLRDVIEVLKETDPERPTETFVGLRTAAFWSRRTAHEVSVHRIDAADAVHAAGGPVPEPLDAESSADGIAELTELQYRFRLAADRIDPAAVGSTVHLHATDRADVEWVITLGEDGVTAHRGHEKSSVALRGDTAALYLTLWRRRPVEALDTVGDLAVARVLLEASRF